MSTDKSPAATVTPDAQLNAQLVGFDLVHLSEDGDGNNTNPRKKMERAALDELKASIKTNGLLNPLTVRPSKKTGYFELIAGERRFSVLKELHEEAPDKFPRLPVIVRPDITDARVPVVQLVENIQRADLTPVEIADGIARALEPKGVSEEALAKELGMSARTMRRYLQLHRAPSWVKEYGRQVKISRKKIDANGQPVIDPKTSKQALEHETKPGLELTLLIEVISLHRKLSDFDVERLEKDGSHKPLADRLTKRLVEKCAVEEWPRAKLEREIARTLSEALGGRVEKDGTGESEGPAYIVDEKRISLTTEAARSLSAGDQEALARRIEKFFRDLGWKSVVLSP